MIREWHIGPTPTTQSLCIVSVLSICIVKFISVLLVLFHFISKFIEKSISRFSTRRVSLASYAGEVLRNYSTRPIRCTPAVNKKFAIIETVNIAKPDTINIVHSTL